MPRLRFELRIFSHVKDDFVQQNRRRWNTLFAIFQARQSKQSANQFVQAAGFELDALEHGSRFPARSAAAPVPAPHSSAPAETATHGKYH